MPSFLGCGCGCECHADADAVGRELGFRAVSTQSNHGKYFQMRDVWKVLTTQLHILSAVNGPKDEAGGGRSPGS